MFSRRQSWKAVGRPCAAWHALPPSAFPATATGTLSKAESKPSSGGGPAGLCAEPEGPSADGRASVALRPAAANLADTLEPGTCHKLNEMHCRAGIKAEGPTADGAPPGACDAAKSSQCLPWVFERDGA